MPETPAAPGAFIVIRALRLPFIGASLLPYAIGAAYACGHGGCSWARTAVGAVLVALAHLAANVLNDYGDAKLGADWQDMTAYGFYGGSKLIQQGVLDERWYLRAGLLLDGAYVALLFVFAAVYGLWGVVAPGIAIAAVAAAYSLPPLKLSYRGLGELCVIALFGPCAVCGGYVLARGALPGGTLFLLSLASGLLTGAILVCNGIADIRTDAAAGKKTLAVRCGFAGARRLFLSMTLGAGTLVAFAPPRALAVAASCAAVATGIAVDRLIGRCGGDAAGMKTPAIVMIAGHAACHALLIALAAAAA